MHSFCWWRMVVRVIECRGGVPLTNEIKIFKHCFTILTVPHTLPELPTCYMEQAGLYSMWQDSCSITHAQHLSQQRQTPLHEEEMSSYRTFTLLYTADNHPCTNTPVEDSRDANPVDSLCQSARLYFRPFIFCNYIHSASYDLIPHPSCDNEGCRF